MQMKFQKSQIFLASDSNEKQYWHLNKIFILFHFSYLVRSRNFRLNITGPWVIRGGGDFFDKASKQDWEEYFFPSRDGQDINFSYTKAQNLNYPQILTKQTANFISSKRSKFNNIRQKNFEVISEIKRMFLFA